MYAARARMRAITKEESCTVAAIALNTRLECTAANLESIRSWSRRAPDEGAGLAFFPDSRHLIEARSGFEYTFRFRRPGLYRLIAGAD